ncbi:unnamed protein product [Somion occarium]|uniref:Aminoglycoside phosphotransferase domain-containing protein n=1 Tax=Somion occarium TaxID=3059160 RepID=A0ABP1E5Y0_9APHY
METKDRSGGIPNEVTFHSKRTTVFPSLPIQGGSILGRLWRALPSRLRLATYKFLVMIGSRLWPSPPRIDTGVQRLPLGLYAKFNGRVKAEEVIANMFVAANTSIPVPRVLDVIDDQGSLFVLMTRLPGVKAAGMLEKLDEQGWRQFERDLQGWWHQLRSLVPPTNVVGSLLGSPSLQRRMSMDRPIGPFDDISAFHHYLMTLCPEDQGTPPYDEFRRLAPIKSFNKPHRLCFTHGDLVPHNLLMENGRLCGLVDFETSGWFPEYWDCTGTYLWGCLWSWSEWQDAVTHIFPQYQDEIEVEKHLWEAVNPY